MRTYPPGEDPPDGFRKDKILVSYILMRCDDDGNRLDDDDGNSGGDGTDDQNNPPGDTPERNPSPDDQDRDPGLATLETSLNPVTPTRRPAPPASARSASSRPDRVFPYRIDFENEASATAPAQRVVITDQLDTHLDWNTFELTEVGFGDVLFSIPAGSQHFQTTVPMTYNSQTFEVEIELGLDSQTGLLTAIFQSIDPLTSLPPDVLTGFLPPEDGTGRGQGYFSYIVRPRPACRPARRSATSPSSSSMSTSPSPPTRSIPTTRARAPTPPRRPATPSTPAAPPAA